MEDFPAAHSMDAEWFGIDETGEVAWLHTYESGPIPKEGLPGLGLFDMVDALDKDEHGIPLLPTPRDFFFDGHSTAALSARLAAASEDQRAALQRLAASDLPPDEEAALKKLWRQHRMVAVVLLADAADAKRLTEGWYILRLDPSAPIYGMGGVPLVDLLRLHARGRVLALQELKAQKRDGYLSDMGLSELLGVYCFSADSSSEERVGADGRTFLWPPRYHRDGIPSKPRVGMPAPLGPEGRKFVHVLPGVRFAEISELQLADHVPCRAWNSYPVEKDKSD